MSQIKYATSDYIMYLRFIDIIVSPLSDKGGCSTRCKRRNLNDGIKKQRVEKQLK
ncbi:hypothetical protein [Clostridium sp.]|uniref:hypothetical protein n=1 Tax=Clostridium sp. TaxID=1506 RepID=UPI0028527B8B|nr:hypothetical protein [Clostridium sp.]